MVQNYSRKIEAQEDTIRALNQRVDHQVNMSEADPDYDGMLRKEVEGLKSENNLMRERVAELSRELDQGGKSGLPTDALEAECRKLRQELQEKERNLLK